MSAEENKKAALVYHQLNPADVESLLTPGFIGHGQNDFAWNRDNHVTFTSTFKGVDTIHEMIAEGDSVASRFTRSGSYGDLTFTAIGLHLMRFENGKLAELWEFWERQIVP